MKDLLYSAILAGILASKEVMNHYINGFTVNYKEDSSPVTSADISSNHLITASLSPLNIPIISEEGKSFTTLEKDNWEKYWCIDPIDGTREFVNKTDEFCICIALIEKKIATLGVIAVPAKNLFYFGGKEIGSFKFSLDYTNWLEYTKMNSVDEIINQSQPIPLKKDPSNYIFLRSKHHLNIKTIEYIKNQKNIHKNLKEYAVGSALKFGLLAEGFADEYSRLSPLNYWDIAAGDAIIKSAGKKIISLESKKEIIYNNEETKVSGFYAY